MSRQNPHPSLRGQAARQAASGNPTVILTARRGALTAFAARRDAKQLHEMAALLLAEPIRHSNAGDSLWRKFPSLSAAKVNA
jgi:hypothetical protein